MFIGMDLGGTTGWCIIDKNVILKSGHQKLDCKKVPAEKYPNFLRLLDKIKALAPSKIDALFYEFVYMPHKSTAAAYAYGGYLACLEVWCDKQQIPMHGIGCTSARKHILGRGNLKKEEAFDLVKLMHPEVKDHNEADAIVVGMYANEHYSEDYEKVDKRIKGNK
jgi:crossover junction endodeoxyribonuclease RuvC